jgi:hypothetical protein
MDFTVDAFNLAKSQMLSDFNKALTAAEAVRKSNDSAPAAASFPEKSGNAAAVLTGATPATISDLDDQAGKSK